MQQTLKSPRCRHPNPYQKVTVVPIDFNTHTPHPPSLETRSPRSNSKTKIRLVSPMRKLNQTAFMSRTNHPTSTNEMQKGSTSPKNSMQIELGGRNSSKNKENTLQSSQKINSNNQHITYLQYSQHVTSKVHASPYGHTQTYVPSHAQSQSRMSSPNKSVHISYKPTPFVINRQTAPLMQAKPTVTFMHVRRGSCGASIPETKSNYPTELQIRQENVIEQLKESYECDINDIKRLKEQIEQNNQEIKKLLKSSRASKETTKSKTLIEPPTVQKQTLHFHTASINNIASVDNSRSISCQKEENQCFQDYQRKDKAICSKKTLINALNFQTQEQLENIANQLPLQHQAVQTQSIPLPAMSHQASTETKNNLRTLKLTLNNVCQLQCIASSNHHPTAHPTMQDSIIRQKQEVFKAQSNSHIKSPKRNSLQASLAAQNLTQLKQQSLKMISSIKSLTKAVYQSDVKRKQKISQSNTELNKEQIDELVESTVPVSQKSIRFEKEKSQTSIPLVVESRKSEVKMPQMHVQVKQNIAAAVQQVDKIQPQPIKIQQFKTVNAQNLPSVVVSKKQGRKINNSIYL